MENPIKIVRYSAAIEFESGTVSNMQCMKGTMEEVKTKAEAVAEKHNVEVVNII
jgi:hypothetical protein